ncbi:hypothetical protein BN871_JC_00030 [Paenibacillus sp. P22]|nr:hypothetical protein BN871_JC_00030 [Paenibacillus sp. P22]
MEIQSLLSGHAINEGCFLQQGGAAGAAFLRGMDRMVFTREGRVRSGGAISASP